MRAWRLHAPGGADAFQLEELPRPEPTPGRVLIAVRAFGLNRSEWFTRNGDSPSVEFPRVLGIECVGEVVADPDGEFAPGQRVAAMMGGMGREFDGSYAEYTSVPSGNVFPLNTDLPWERLGALPEMLQTVNGSLTLGLGVESGQTILIRGGTSSIGMMTLCLAKARGLRVVTTTRSPSKRDLLLAQGADQVLVDAGELAPALRALYPHGVNGVLELIGATTLLDSLACSKQGGVVCMTGILGGQWELAAFRPMEQIPSGVRLTSYSGGAGDISREELQRYVDLVGSGALSIPQGPVWRFDQLIEAHRAMDANRANGKMVVLL